MKSKMLCARWLPLFSALLASVSGLSSADVPGTTLLVGDLGRKEALVFRGIQTFTKEQILDGMKWHIDYHLAAHPEAPLAEYANRLRRKVELGYQRSGFPDVVVNVTPDTNTRQMMVRVAEGPRYRCGELLLAGVETMTNAAVRQKILDRLSGLEPGNSTLTNAGAASWSRDQPVPFDEPSQKHIADRINEALEELDYYEPKVNVRITPDPARKLADLHVEIADEGMKGVIDEIEINGLYTNTQQQVLEYLKLKAGMGLRASVIAGISNQLVNSARFLRHDLTLRPQPQAGKFKLELDLEEWREAPPLNQEFSPETKALLKFRDWLTDLENHAEDIVLSIIVTNETIRMDVEAALSASGLALAARLGLSNEPPQLKYAFVASEKQIGFYSPWRKSKHASRPKDKELSISVGLIPDFTPGRHAKHRIAVAGGIQPQKSRRPFRINMNLHPTGFVSGPEDSGVSRSLADGVLTITKTKTPERDAMTFQVEAATGRLIQHRQHSGEVEMRVRSEEGVFARLVKEVAAVTADHQNEYVTNRGFSSWLSFLATDLIESPVVEPILQGRIKEHVPKEERTNALAELKKIKAFLAVAREVFNKQNFAGIVDPFDRLAAKDADVEEDQFFVPWDDSMRDMAANPMMWFSAAALIYSDALLTRDSWPWVLLRETAFTLAGQGKYSEAEMNKLLKSDGTGPLGYLATARLLGKSSPKLARVFAQRGLSRLTASDFQKDYRLLFQSDSIGSETLNATLGLVRTLNDAQATALATNLPGNEAAFFRELALLVRQSKDQQAGAAAWPAFERYWNEAMRRYFEAGLNHFLPQVQFLTNSDALYKRGLALVAPDAALQDLDEAAQCFRKAADQGHAGAQLKLGFLYGNGLGVREDFAEAMRWSRKAADQKEPHAACQVADLYRDGKGVKQDVDEAARWYRIDGENLCARSQFELGRIYEMQNKMPEALQWYRRAADAGHVDAQAHLGDVLSDGFFTTPDYVEACQWLSLAAMAQDKMSEIRLRRIKAKLSAEQLGEVEKKVAVIADRLGEKKKAGAARN